MTNQFSQQTAVHARMLERYYRSVGLFEAAVAQQRAADLMESGDARWFMTTHLDRGVATGLCAGAHHGFFQIWSADNAVCIGLTRDRAATLLMVLLAHLEVTPEELHDLARWTTPEAHAEVNAWLRETE